MGSVCCVASMCMVAVYEEEREKRRRRFCLPKKPVVVNKEPLAPASHAAQSAAQQRATADVC